MNVRGRVRWLLAPAVVAVTVAGPLTTQAGQVDLPGSQGTDTALALTESALTVPGRGRFGNLQVTLNQTANLNNQAISITWTGGDPTTNPTRIDENFLQIMQCWGDDDGTVPENPGPPPEQCVQGATTGTPNASSVGLPSAHTTQRMISFGNWENYDPTIGYVESSTTKVWLPFHAVDGTVVNTPENPDYEPSEAGSQFWQNTFFNRITTNEIAGGITRPDGTGAELFQTLTGVQSSGLGCGQRSEPVGDGTKKIPQCWIVIVPRGTSVEENVGTPFSIRAETKPVSTSPVAPAAWANRIAVPISFNPVDSPCSFGQTERRISGNDLATTAVASWQPVLCSSGELPPFSYSPVADSSARQLVSNPTAGAPGMVVLSRQVRPDLVDPANPVLYAPLTASAIAIGFNVERTYLSLTPDVLAVAEPLRGTRVAQINLTPRLVAKLLTQSYRLQLAIGQQVLDADWLDVNPDTLAQDPDFVQFNPEFEILNAQYGREFSGLQVPVGNSDAAQQVWEWILADPEARTWLDGVADPWGMRVNPVYSTSASVNPSGFPFGDPAPNSFPKSDPTCFQGADLFGITPPLLCGTDWMPYARSFAETALRTRTAYDGARVAQNPAPLGVTDVWKTVEPQFNGRRSILSITDTASAARYGVQTARLSRAGDNGANRQFVAPTADGISTAIEAMETGVVPQVLQADPAGLPAGAYPLAAVTYAAIAPVGLDAAARDEYAAFIAYATSSGQDPGTSLGQLPVGYVPLPADLREQAASVVVSTLDPAALVTPTTTTTTSTTTSTTTAPTVPTSTSVSQVASSTAEPLPGPVLSPSSGGNNSGSSGGGSGGGGGGASNVTTSTSVTTTAPTEGTVVETTVPTPSTEPTTTEIAVGPTATTSTTTTTTLPQLTPSTAAGPIRWAVPSVAGLGLLSALGALEITKRPRRAVKAGGL
jgi:hypothetical protein